MKDNNQSLSSEVVKVINSLFKENGKKDIPDIKLICTKAQVTRSMALKCLYKWWEKQQTETGSSQLLHDLPPLEKDQNPYHLQNAITDVQCLEKELEIYNHTLDSLSPVGNFILGSLQEVEAKLFAVFSYLEELSQSKEEAEKKLKKTQQENNRLCKKIDKNQKSAEKKLDQLKIKLNERKKEAVAAHHLVKALKRDKRRPTFKTLYNAITH